MEYGALRAGRSVRLEYRQKQDGERFKADFIRGAEAFVDEEMFGGAKVSNLLYRMCNYYLLEPERVHVCTMSAKHLTLPMNETKYAHIFDLKDGYDDFYFDNVIDYVRRVLADIEKVDFDARMKREILVNAKMVILGSEICKLKMNPAPSAEKIDEVVAMIDQIRPEYVELWNVRNYEKGIDKFLTHIDNRRKELLALK
jgi:hypothetical protein